MRENGIELSTIGFLSWVGMAYSLKFLWAPLVDKIDAPVLGRWLGRRRGWMLLAQIVVAWRWWAWRSCSRASARWCSRASALNQLLVFGGLALVVAFASATQDIVIDAWRIESADNADQQGLLTSASTLGYRGALLVTDSLILILAGARRLDGVVRSRWRVLMGVGTSRCSWRANRQRACARRRRRTRRCSRRAGCSMRSLGPFVAFFRDHGRWALLMLAAISLYRLPDFLMGPMANPFYADSGIDKDVVGAVRGSIGSGGDDPRHRRRGPGVGALRGDPDAAGGRGARAGLEPGVLATSHCTAPTRACSRRRWRSTTSAAGSSAWR